MNRLARSLFAARTARDARWHGRYGLLAWFMAAMFFLSAALTLVDGSANDTTRDALILGLLCAGTGSFLRRSARDFRGPES